MLLTDVIDRCKHEGIQKAQDVVITWNIFGIFQGLTSITPEVMTEYQIWLNRNNLQGAYRGIKVQERSQFFSEIILGGVPKTQ